MKTLRNLIVSLWLLNTACTTVYTPQGDKQIVATSEHTLVNNTDFLLDVTINGAKVYHRITPGQVVSLRGTFLSRSTVVIVTAYDGDGTYHGASTGTFHLNQPQAWLVSMR